ncbi:MAG: HD domain-containing protein [Clostridia bacterium]|nr:HD domain-containing protein [Clostridia bacterium]
MRDRIQALYIKMLAFDGGRPDLAQHFTKVHAYAKLIGEAEQLPSDTMEILEAAALVHDIAIPLCEKKSGTEAGHYQEIEGPDMAREMLSTIGFDEAVTERVAWLVGHHHTYKDIDKIDYQILVEADFIVNAYESKHSDEAKQNTLKNIFKTKTGTSIFKTMFEL